MTKREESNREWFRAEVSRWLESIGAKPGSFYAYTLETRLGILHITPYGNWVACRWEDVPRAYAEIGDRMNRYSGKWNHHYDRAMFENRQDTKAALHDFQSCLSAFF